MTEMLGEWLLGGLADIAGNATVHGAITQTQPPITPCDCGYPLSNVLAASAAYNDNALLEADPFIANHFVSVRPGPSFHSPLDVLVYADHPSPRRSKYS